MLTNNKLHSKTANAAFINTGSLFMHLGHLGRKQFSSQEYSFKTYPYHYERPRSQYWFGWFQESASKGVEALPYLRSNVGEYAGFDSAFNLTMDVRRDSDVYFAHNGNVHQVYTNQLEIMNRYGVENEEILPHKTASQLAAAIISNCDKTPHAKWRMQVVDALVEAGLTLTGTGRCFKDHPSPNVVYIADRFDTSTGEKFNMATSVKKHKFYLSFENALHCRDYVSEKLWRNAYMNLAVPIVYGPWKDDIVKRAPPHSFIFLEDFNSAKDLVDYLNYLNSNDTAYEEYFAWRKDIRAALNPENDDPNLRYITEYENGDLFKVKEGEFKGMPMCGVCKHLRKLEAQGNPEKIITSYSYRTWMDNPDHYCTNSDRWETYYDKDVEYLPGRSSIYTYADEKSPWLDLASISKK